MGVGRTDSTPMPFVEGVVMFLGEPGPRPMDVSPVGVRVRGRAGHRGRTDDCWRYGRDRP